MKNPLLKISSLVFILAVSVGYLVQHAVMDDQIRTIRDIKSSDTVGGTVSVRGTISYALDNRFILTDGTGQVEISTCPLWYKRIDLHKGDKVTVTGQVMHNSSFFADCDFILSAYKIFNNGLVVEVRRRPGKPPWMSYRSGKVSEVRTSRL